MREENHQYGLSEKKRQVSAAINRVAIGLILILWGSLLTLKQVGLIEKSVSTLPFIFAAFGALLIFGGIYKLRAHMRLPT